VLEVAHRQQMVLLSETQPSLHLGPVVLILMRAKAVLCIEVGEDPLEEEQPTFGVGKLLLPTPLLLPLLLLYFLLLPLLLLYFLLLPLLLLYFLLLPLLLLYFLLLLLLLL